MSDSTQPSAPEPDMPAWRKLATRQIWILPVWAYILIVFIVVVALSGGGDTTDDQTATEPAPAEFPTAAPTAEVEATIRCSSIGMSAELLTQGTASTCEEAFALYRSLIPATFATPGFPAVDSEIILACYSFQGDSVLTYETAERGRMYDALHGTACDGDRSNLIPA